MKIKPQIWTRHHISRLYHMSMLASFSFIVAIVIYGIFAVLWQANALTLTEQSDQGVSATVPSISSGPAVVEPSGGGGGTTPALPALLNPFVTVAAKNAPSAPVKLADGSIINLPSFNTQNPAFSGSTNVKNAIIFIEVKSSPIIRATTFADINGQWSWSSPEAVLPGQRTILVIAQDPQLPGIIAKASLDFYIEPTALAEPRPTPTFKPVSPTNLENLEEGNLFDVLVSIPDQFKIIAPGDELAANVKLINFGSVGHPVDVSVQYTITDERGKTIMQSSETLAVATQLSILKTFNINPSIETGKYKLIVRVPSKDVIATAEADFEIKGVPVLPVGLPGKVDATFLFQVLLALLFIFSLITYLEYNKVSVLSHFIRKVDEEDLRLYNH